MVMSIVFKDHQMQKIWDMCQHDLPDSLWQAIFTDYCTDNTPPNGHIIQMTAGYLFCLHDQGKSDDNLTTFFNHIVRFCPQY